jgi:hypothetical protein
LDNFSGFECVNVFRTPFSTIYADNSFFFALFNIKASYWSNIENAEEPLFEALCNHVGSYEKAKQLSGAMLLLKHEFRKAEEWL